jgi:hypothetical protein
MGILALLVGEEHQQGRKPLASKQASGQPWSKAFVISLFIKSCL